MKITKILALILAVLMAVGCLAACGGSSDDKTEATNVAGTATGDEAGNAGGTATTYSVPFSDAFVKEWGEFIKTEEGANGAIKLKVWGPELAQPVLKTETEAFIALFKDYVDIQIELGVQGEGEAPSAVINDPTAAADVFGFASDQLAILANANTLAVNLFKDAGVTDMNTAASVNAATYNGKLLAYPETGDNSYFLGYDKRVVTEEQAKTLEGVLEACKAAGKKFVMDAGNGYFGCMFLYTGGLQTLGLEDDGVTQKLNNYDIDQVTASVKAFADLFKKYTGTFEAGATGQAVDGFKNDPTTVGAGVVGSWDVAQIKAALGDNAGFAILPTINIGGTDTQIINMFGYKFLGVNSASKYPYTAQLLAYYLSGEACQQERAEVLEWGPSNINVQQSDFVKSNAAMTAILAQSEFSLPQVGIAGTFWDAVAGLGKYMTDAKSDLSEAALKQQVEACISGILDE